MDQAILDEGCSAVQSLADALRRGEPAAVAVAARDCHRWCDAASGSTAGGLGGMRELRDRALHARDAAQRARQFFRMLRTGSKAGTQSAYGADARATENAPAALVVRIDA